MEMKQDNYVLTTFVKITNKITLSFQCKFKLSILNKNALTYMLKTLERRL